MGRECILVQLYVGIGTNRNTIFTLDPQPGTDCFGCNPIGGVALSGRSAGTDEQLVGMEA